MLYTLSRFFQQCGTAMFIRFDYRFAIDFQINREFQPKLTRNTRRWLVVFQMIYFTALLWVNFKVKAWPYGFLERIGIVNYIFVFIPVHLILLDALYRSQVWYIHEDLKAKQKIS